MIGKKTIVNNFSRYAHLYDSYADIQLKAAGRLLSEIRSFNPGDILEIGCGTGNYTLLLKDWFKSSRLKAIDISERMVAVAKEKLKGREAEFIVADAENSNFNEKFDLITSNACFQWFKDPVNSISRYKNFLKDDGMISFSLFGPLTFWQLNNVIKCVFDDTAIQACGFITKETIKEIMDNNFASVKIKEVNYEEHFPDFKSLLEKIKYSGIRGNGLSVKINFTSGTIKKLEQVYLDKFKAIKVNYQVFFCLGT